MRLWEAHLDRPRIASAPVRPVILVCFFVLHTVHVEETAVSACRSGANPLVRLSCPSRSELRFDTERRRDQSRIAGLVEDTQAIEEALLQATLGPSTVEHAQTRIATSLESHRRMKHEGSVGFGEGSGDGVNISSPVGTIGGPTAKGFAKSNAYIQRSDEKENSRFISTQQARPIPTKNRPKAIACLNDKDEFPSKCESCN